MLPANWLHEAPNPFNLSAPPAWFRLQMAAQDAALVIFPSQEEGVYRVARRAPHATVARFSLGFVRKRPDTKTYIDNGLVPVTSLLPFTQWGPVVLSDLAEMDIQRFGGAEKVADELDRRDAEYQKEVDAEIRNVADQAAGAAYRGAKWTNGDTIDIGGSVQKGAGTGNLIVASA